MKHRFIALLLLLLAASLVMTGCENEGKLKVNNRTSYPLYLGVHGELYTIGADSSLTLRFVTPTQSIVNPDTGLDIDIYLSGETFQIWDAYLSAFVDSTTVRINTGETTSAYANPNRACVKVVNLSQRWIKKIIVQRNTVSTTNTFTYDVYMAPGDSWFKQQVPSTTTNTYFYLVQIVFENDDILSYGDNQNVLYKDDQFLVTVLEPD